MAPPSPITPRSGRAKALRGFPGDRARRALPAALLLASLAAGSVGAVQAYQAQRSHHDMAQALLREYGSFAAFLYLNHLDALFYAHLKQTLGTLGAAVEAGAEPRAALTAALGAPRKAETCPECYPSIAGSWAFYMELPGAEAPIIAGAPTLDAEVVDAYVGAVTAHAREKFRPWLGVAVVHVGAGSEERLLAYSRFGRAAGDTVVFGAELDPSEVKNLAATPFKLADLLPPSMSNGRSNEKLLAVRVLSESGVPLFESAPSALMEPMAEEDIYPMLGGGRIQASVLPEAADLLIIGGLPRNRLPILLTVFGIAGLLALLAAAQMRKEEAFARQRADFVASVSHELRTPLAQLRLFIETLQLGRAHTEEQKVWALGTIDRETRRLTQLVENILHFSRAERGLGGLEMEPADLSVECRDAAASFLPLLRSGQAELVCAVPPGLTAEVHRDSFRQVLLNLLDNAVKYGPAGQTITIRGSRARTAVHIAVEDQGPGVPPAERDLIWDPFRRGASATGSVATGSGIGLSVVREIVLAHRGRAWVEEVPGGGARFVVELPVGEER